MKIINFHKLLVFIVLMFALSACTNKEKNQEAEASAVKNLVETYCRADSNGANLSSDNYLKSGLPGFMVAGDFESPGWDTVSLIKKYSITSVKVNGKIATVIVTYDTLGEVPGAEKVTIDKKNENYSFNLVKNDEKWKLKTPYDLQPHILVDTAIIHIQELYETQKESQPNAPAVIQRLKQLKEKV